MMALSAGYSLFLQLKILDTHHRGYDRIKNYTGIREKRSAARKKIMQYYPLNLNAISDLIDAEKNCVFLDSARGSGNNNYSYLFYDPIKILVVREYDDIEDFLAELDTQSQNQWIAGYLSYEAAYALENRFYGFTNAKPPELPLGWFGVFEEPLRFDHTTGKWNRDIPEVPDSTDSSEYSHEQMTVTHQIDEPVFHEKIHAIRQAIKDGETYQVNFTYDVRVSSSLPPFVLFRQLREGQRTPYCAYIQNEYGFVASLSPELFFTVRDGYISTKPMKGTAPRGLSAEEDRGMVSFLEQDEKNRAENLMIVDLLRNDLGRICRPGTVVTEKLFEVETHPTVHQMTSTITGKLMPGARISTIIKNIFPCGSVTGAPKVRTMEIIHELETGCRGVYCGAIGFTAPNGTAAFNVPIRTLQKGNGDSSWRFRVGSGIVWDSSAEMEWLECADKTRFLEYRQPAFDLLETMLFDKKFTYVDDHKARLQASAEYFGYPFSGDEFDSLLHRIADELDDVHRYKIRILLNSAGELNGEHAVIDPAVQRSRKLLFSSQPVNEQEIMLYHKSTYRPWYTVAGEKISSNACYDVLFYNSKGQITEGARSNVFIEKKGTLYTPPVSCGLLPGVLRKNLLHEGKCKERILFKDDFLSADAVYCGNSVRGLVNVEPVL